METKQKFHQGLQWGAIAWLGHIVVQAARDSLLMAAPWIVACVLLAAGSRWARAAVALCIVGRLDLGLHEAALAYSPTFWPDVSTYWLTISWLHLSGIATCLGLIPLVAWRAEGLRVTVALVALGRFREAWARAGGVIALLSAVPMMAINRATVDFLTELEVLPIGLVLAALALARYGDVIVAWPTRGRQPG